MTEVAVIDDRVAVIHDRRWCHRDRHVGRSDRRGCHHGRLPGRRCMPLGEPRFEVRLHGGPLFGDDREVDRVAQGAVVAAHVPAKNALFGRPDPPDGRARSMRIAVLPTPRRRRPRRSRRRWRPPPRADDRRSRGPARRRFARGRDTECASRSQGRRAPRLRTLRGGEVPAVPVERGSLRGRRAGGACPASRPSHGRELGERDRARAHAAVSRRTRTSNAPRIRSKIGPGHEGTGRPSMLRTATSPAPVPTRKASSAARRS